MEDFLYAYEREWNAEYPERIGQLKAIFRDPIEVSKETATPTDTPPDSETMESSAALESSDEFQKPMVFGKNRSLRAASANVIEPCQQNDTVRKQKIEIQDTETVHTDVADDCVSQASPRETRHEPDTSTNGTLEQCQQNEAVLEQKAENRDAETEPVHSEAADVCESQASPMEIRHDSQTVHVDIGSFGSRILGNRGETINRIRKACNVTAEIIGEPGNPQTVILGGDEANVLRAKKMLEDIKVMFSVTEHIDVGSSAKLIIGYRGETIRNIGETCNVTA
eukprot:842995_1